MSYPIPSVRVSVVHESTEPATGPPTLRTAEDAARIMWSSGWIPPDDEREHFGVLLLSVRHHVRAWHTVSIGCLTSSLVHPREVFRAAIIAGAAAMVLIHNHP